LERDYAPWTAAANALDFIDIMLYGGADFSEWKVSNYHMRFIQEKTDPLLPVSMN
jgi:hypothetical protein